VDGGLFWYSRGTNQGQTTSLRTHCPPQGGARPGAARWSARRGTGAEAGDKRSDSRAVEAELKRAFRPEFLNRLDDVIVFHPLGRAQVRTHRRRVPAAGGSRTDRSSRCVDVTPPPPGFPVRWESLLAGWSDNQAAPQLCPQVAFFPPDRKGLGCGQITSTPDHHHRHREIQGCQRSQHFLFIPDPLGTLIEPRAPLP